MQLSGLISGRWHRGYNDLPEDTHQKWQSWDQALKSLSEPNTWPRPLDWQASPCAQASIRLLCKKLISHGGLCSQGATVDSLETQTVNQARAERQPSCSLAPSLLDQPRQGDSSSEGLQGDRGWKGLFALCQAPWLVG